MTTDEFIVDREAADRLGPLCHAPGAVILRQYHRAVERSDGVFPRTDAPLALPFLIRLDSLKPCEATCPLGSGPDSSISSASKIPAEPIDVMPKVFADPRARPVI